VQITERDRTLLSFVAQHRLVLGSHVEVLLGISADAAQARLRALRSGGLLESERFFYAQPRCWWITAKGLAAIDSPLPRPRIDLHSHRHDLGMGWVWLAAARGAFGPLDGFVSERAMRSQDGARVGSSLDEVPATEPFGVRLGGVGPAGRERLHYPDLLLITPSGGRIGVELELTAKERTRRERILAGYGADPRVDAVLYLVDRPAVGRAIEASARRVAVSSMVHVQRVRWGDSGRTPEAAAALARSRGQAREHAVER
jgi:hypothetical protein